MNLPGQKRPTATFPPIKAAERRVPAAGGQAVGMWAGNWADAPPPQHLEPSDTFTETPVPSENGFRAARHFPPC